MPLKTAVIYVNGCVCGLLLYQLFQPPPVCGKHFIMRLFTVKPWN